MQTTADVLVTVLGLLIAQAGPPSSIPAPPKTIKELIERELGPIKKPPFVIKRCKWPCERSA